METKIQPSTSSPQRQDNIVASDAGLVGLTQQTVESLDVESSEQAESNTNINKQKNTTMFNESNNTIDQQTQAPVVSNDASAEAAAQGSTTAGNPFSSWMDDPVIKAQATALEQLNQQAAEKQQKISERITELSKLLEAFTFIHKDGTIVNKKAGYINYNRKINEKKVKEYEALIKDGKYLDDYPIFVADAAEFITSNPGNEIKDASGKIVTEDKYSDYYVILDGQHRSRAWMRCLINGSAPKSVNGIPGVMLKSGVNDIGSFLRDINPGNSWNNEEAASVAALTKGKYSELLKAIADRIAEGFNPSTASQIYCGTPISSNKYKKLRAGDHDSVTISQDIKKGDEFIRLCKEAKIEIKYLTKRYFIEGFIDYKNATDDETAI